MPDNRRIRAALDLLNMLESQQEAEEAADAAFWVICATDPESGKQTLTGPYPDPVAALVAAERWETELNAGAPPTETPYKVTALPVLNNGVDR